MSLAFDFRGYTILARHFSIFDCDMYRKQEALQQVRWGAQRAVQEANELLAGGDQASDAHLGKPGKLQTLEAASEALEAMLRSIRSLRPVQAHKQQCQHALEAHHGQHNQHEGASRVAVCTGKALFAAKGQACWAAA